MALAIAVNALVPIVASADTSSDLHEATEELQELTGELKSAETDVENARQAMADNATELRETQDKLASLRSRIEEIVVMSYKDGWSGSPVINVIRVGDIGALARTLADASQVRERLSADMAEQTSLSERRQRQADELSRLADDAQARLDELTDRKEELDAKASELRVRSQEERDAARRKAASTAIDAASLTSSSASTFVTDPSGDGWTDGVASAYGGSSDPGTGSTTADGSTVSDWSMGVAIPLAWGRRDLLGRQVEISYGGKSVIATINDLGGMGGGSRSLDLQPGVFKALGASTCDAWGIRTVQYRIL